jgi:hypothetical protein
VIPQFLGRPTFLDQVTELAAQTGAEFHEVVLLDSRDGALRRFTARPSSEPVEPAEWDRMYDGLLAVIATRPTATVVPTVAGEVDRAYRDFLRCLGR